MYPVPADVRRLMYKVKHAQGVDITRIFCGLNETRNIIPSIKYALEAGMIPGYALHHVFSRPYGGRNTLSATVLFGIPTWAAVFGGRP